MSAFKAIEFFKRTAHAPESVSVDHVCTIYGEIGCGVCPLRVLPHVGGD